MTPRDNDSESAGQTRVECVRTLLASDSFGISIWYGDRTSFALDYMCGSRSLGGLAESFPCFNEGMSKDSEKDPQRENRNELTHF